MVRTHNGATHATGEPKPPKPTPTKIYVGKIPQKYQEEDLKNLAQEFGSVLSFFYLEDCSGTDAGWCLITYKEKSEAESAIDGFQQTYRFETRLSSSQNFAGGPEPQEEEQEEAAPLKLDEVLPRQVGKWREYSTPEGHKYYFNIETNLTTWEKPMEMMGHAGPYYPRPNMQMLGSKANVPPVFGAIGGGAQGPFGANLFCYNCPQSWVESDLAQHFAAFGRIVSVRLNRDEQGRSKGYGFISYDNPKSALQGIHSMNGYVVDGKALQVSLKKGEEHYITTHLTSPAGAVGNQLPPRPASVPFPGAKGGPQFMQVPVAQLHAQIQQIQAGGKATQIPVPSVPQLPPPTPQQMQQMLAAAKAAQLMQKQSLAQ